MKTAVSLARILLGLTFLVFGLDYFFHFLHLIVTFPGLERRADNYLAALNRAEYFFPCLKIIEILCGLGLLINRYTAIFLIMLFPITFNIFLFDAFLGPQLLLMGAVLILLNIFLMLAYRRNYRGLFAFKPAL
ncbi:DoxX family membrane protein [Mucilaginibacter terrenus]|uniref:DoxX family membrane protein n=1 Tax=Mucilaginibacter terrenus TaxID=2482727 RepID=A0A3E2NY83_9SPHI|nr:DoxX family membrane protein [Mucilaginibacter terrenus]RFZ85975.1 DoxX family membrane protein [Mucilaginibacter terrenus]